MIFEICDSTGLDFEKLSLFLFWKLIPFWKPFGLCHDQRKITLILSDKKIVPTENVVINFQNINFTIFYLFFSKTHSCGTPPKWNSFWTCWYSRRWCAASSSQSFDRSRPFEVISSWTELRKKTREKKFHFHGKNKPTTFSIMFFWMLFCCAYSLCYASQ